LDGGICKAGIPEYEPPPDATIKSHKLVDHHVRSCNEVFRSPLISEATVENACDRVMTAPKKRGAPRLIRTPVFHLRMIRTVIDTK
jgi:hypothetical protein